MKRKVFCLVLTLLLMLSLAVPACAVNKNADADILYALGLFKGAGTLPDGRPDYALERSLSRQEAVTMLVRLLGKEQDAKAGNWQIPFTDVDAWAVPYVGYAYANGLTAGISASAFGGAQPVTASQYLTFILRALGYSSGQDFAWNAAWEKSDALGITNGDYTAENNAGFLRGDAVSISKAALAAKLKNGASTLLEQLVTDGAVTQEKAEQSGLLPEPDAYSLFARKIIDAGKDPVIVTLDDNDMMGRTALAPIFKEYDGYAANSVTLEKALVLALEGYLKQCYDGDYSDGYSGTPTFRSWGSNVDVFLLTDTKGTIIAYGVRTDKSSKDFTLYSCKVDSKKFINGLVQERQDMIAQLQNIPCEGQELDRQYVFTFAELPENTAYFTVSGCVNAQGTLRRPVRLETAIDNMNARIRNGWLEYYPVSETFTTASDYTFDKSGESWHFVMFWDEAMNPLGYSLVCIPIIR